MNEISGYSLPAEWEECEAVLLSWPHEATDWAYMLDQVTICFSEIVKAISKYAKVVIVAPDTSAVAGALKGLVSPERLVFIETPTNDTWARDFGMITTRSADGRIRINDFVFNGWGLKFHSCFDNQVTRNMMRSVAVNPEASYANCLDFVLEGGSIDVDGRGSLLTTSECLLSPNRNAALSKADIESVLKERLGCTRILWLDHGYLQGDDTDSHIDTLARFVSPHAIAYSSCDRPYDDHYPALKAMEAQLKEFSDCDGQRYELFPLPIPNAIFDENGERLPATYANFMIVNGAVLLPVYGDEFYDSKAIDTIKAAMPLYDIVPIDCRPLIRQHGSLHCVTMQLPKGVLV